MLLYFLVNMASTLYSKVNRLWRLECKTEEKESNLNMLKRYALFKFVDKPLNSSSLPINKQIQQHSKNKKSSHYYGGQFTTLRR